LESAVLSIDGLRSDDKLFDLLDDIRPALISQRLG
jgi:hypothetical protein